MLSIKNLQLLAGQKKGDAKQLLLWDRRTGAIYLMGYALEFSLKSKIARTLNFSNGFPQSRAEFNSYSLQIAAFNAVPTGIQLNALSQIRNHDLQLLLKYSGAEARVIGNCYDDWLIVKNWNPENRYKVTRYRYYQVIQFMKSAKKILREIS